MKKVADSPANAVTFCLFYHSIGSFLSGLSGEFKYKNPLSPPFIRVSNWYDNIKLKQYDKNKLKNESDSANIDFGLKCCQGKKMNQV
jgi:hypothetical protein